MAGELQPLDQQFAIVDEQGRPTQYFIRWAQQRQIDIGTALTLDDLGDYLAAHMFSAAAGSGIGLTPDGNLANSPAITAKVQEILDQISAVRGTVLYRGAAGWAALAPGAAGLFLQTAGAGADPLWAAAGGGGGGYGYEGFGNLVSIAVLTKLGGASANITLVDGTKAHRYSWTASGANTLQLATAVAPATPWNLYLRFIPDIAYAANVQFGLVLRNSTSGKITTCTWNSDLNFSIQEWTNPTTFSANLVNLAVPRLPQIWFRISNDGTTLSFYRSVNGVDWVLLTTRTLAAFMGSVDQVGLGGVPQVAGSAVVSDFGLTVPA